MCADNKEKEPTVLHNWALTLDDGITFAKIEENDLDAVHISGYVTVEPTGEGGCEYCPYKNGGNVHIVTSHIKDVDENNVFITKYESKYKLGSPHKTFAGLFGELGLENRIVDAVRKKRLL
jgi:hypothetical protein